jgi:hypothetical protein
LREKWRLQKGRVYGRVYLGHMLDMYFGYSFEENPKCGGDAQQQKKEEKVGEKCAVKAHSRLRFVVKAYMAEEKERK